MQADYPSPGARWVTIPRVLFGLTAEGGANLRGAPLHFGRVEGGTSSEPSSLAAETVCQIPTVALSDPS